MILKTNINQVPFHSVIDNTNTRQKNQDRSKYAENAVTIKRAPKTVLIVTIAYSQALLHQFSSISASSSDQRNRGRNLLILA